MQDVLSSSPSTTAISYAAQTSLTSVEEAGQASLLAAPCMAVSPHEAQISLTTVEEAGQAPSRPPQQ